MFVYRERVHFNLQHFNVAFIISQLSYFKNLEIDGIFGLVWFRFFFQKFSLKFFFFEKSEK